jgi:GNAT superfamily N-acetyltransferase
MIAPVTEQHFEIIERFYSNLGVPARIHQCLFADRSLSRLLEQRGFSLERKYDMLACRLPGDLADMESAPGVTVTLAKEDQADLWIRTTAQGFSEEEEPSQATLDVLSGNFYAPNAACFLAWVDGQPAGGGGLYIQAEAAELGGASTRPQFRRRGVHAALLKRRLEAAYAAGCDLAMTQTSPSSASNKNIRRHGFQQAYYKVVFVLDKDDKFSYL